MQTSQKKKRERECEREREKRKGRQRQGGREEADGYTMICWKKQHSMIKKILENAPGNVIFSLSLINE